jgi:uncharacterized Zn finger protein
MAVFIKHHIHTGLVSHFCKSCQKQGKWRDVAKKHERQRSFLRCSGCGRIHFIRHIPHKGYRTILIPQLFTRFIRSEVGGL